MANEAMAQAVLDHAHDFYDTGDEYVVAEPLRRARRPFDGGRAYPGGVRESDQSAGGGCRRAGGSHDHRTGYGSPGVTGWTGAALAPRQGAAWAIGLVLAQGRPAA